MKHFYFGPDGGQVDVIDAGGEIVRTFECGPGLHPWAQFAPFRGNGETLHGGPVVSAQGNTRSQRSPHHFDSAANQSFKVSDAARQARTIRDLLLRTEALQKRTAAQARAMSRARAVKVAPAPDAAAAGETGAPVSAT